MSAGVPFRGPDHRNADAPLLAMTGMVFDDDRERCLAAGMDDVVAKPLSARDLQSPLAALHCPFAREEPEKPVSLVS